MPADVDRQFGDVARLIRRSMLFGLLQAIIGTGDAAVERSRIVAAMRTGTARFSQLPPEERMSNVALFVVVAALTELAITLFIPARSAPAIPGATWVVIAIVAALPASMPGAVLTAWANRKKLP